MQVPYGGTSVFGEPFTSFRTVADPIDTGRIVVESEVLENFEELVEAGALLPYTKHHVWREKGWDIIPSAVPFQAIPESSGKPSYWGPLVFDQKPAPLFEIHDVSAVVDRLSQHAWAEARRGAVQIAIELYQAPKVMALFSDFTYNVLKRKDAVIRYMKSSKKWRKTADYRRTRAGDQAAFAEAWLEYRYGWRLLYYSARSLLQGLETLLGQSEKVLVRKAAFQSVPMDLISIPLANPVCLCNYPNQFVQNWPFTLKVVAQSAETEVRCRTAMVVDKARVAVDSNLLLFAWDAVPYSFVVDWVFNTADFFGALWPSFTGPGEETNCFSTRTRVNLTVEGKLEPPFNRFYSSSRSTWYEVKTGGPTYATYEYEMYNRTPIDSGDISFNLSLDPNFNWQKVIDLLALLNAPLEKWGRFFRRRKRRK